MAGGPSPSRVAYVLDLIPKNMEERNACESIVIELPC